MKTRKSLQTKLTLVWAIALTFATGFYGVKIHLENVETTENKLDCYELFNGEWDYKKGECKLPMFDGVYPKIP